MKKYYVIKIGEKYVSVEGSGTTEPILTDYPRMAELYENIEHAHSYASHYMEFHKNNLFIGEVVFP